MQHAEHYFRVLRALQPQRPVSEIAARELSNQGYDIDFEDETGAQAAAFLAAQQAADRAAQGGENRDNNSDGGQNRDNSNRDDQPRDGQNRNDGQSGQKREWRDRDNNPDRDRSQNRDYQNRDRGQNRDRDSTGSDGQTRDTQARDGQPRDGQTNDEARADGEGRPRETRRERWERRREERNRRFEAEGGQPDTRTFEESEGRGTTAETVESQAVAGTIYEPAADDVAPVKAERPRRTRATREPAESAEAPVGLPSFLTRSSAPVTAPTPAADFEAASDEPVAPKRRAPRRKAETPVDSES